MRACPEWWASYVRSFVCRFVFFGLRFGTRQSLLPLSLIMGSYREGVRKQGIHVKEVMGVMFQSLNGNYKDVWSLGLRD